MIPYRYSPVKICITVLLFAGLYTYAQDTSPAASAPVRRAVPPVKTPTAVRPDIKVEKVMDIAPSAVRLIRNPVTGEFWYTTYEGDVYQIKNFGKPQAESVKRFTAKDHGLVRLQGAVFLNNTLFLNGNVSNNGGTPGILNGNATQGKMVKFDLSTPTPVMTVVFTTDVYGTNATTFDHGWNALCLSADNKYIYVTTGARTDHGEVQDNKGAFPNARDNALTAKIFRIPAGTKNLHLADDLAKLKAAGYIYAEGIRNCFDLALDGKGQLFGVSNSSDYDFPEEMYWIRQGHHYGFPWQVGGIDNPQQFPDWIPDPATDPFISPGAHAWLVRYFRNDPQFPKIPEGVKFTAGVQNFGPDANEYRDPASGKVVDGDVTGRAISSFPAHCVPMGLFFDTKNVLIPEFKGDGFVFRYGGGGRVTDSGPSLRSGGKDMLHLDLEYNALADNYYMKATKIVENFNAPTDAVMVGNEVFVIENSSIALGAPGRIWKITLPADKKPAAVKK